jgi:hypothetical protein
MSFSLRFVNNHMIVNLSSIYFQDYQNYLMLIIVSFSYLIKDFSIQVKFSKHYKIYYQFYHFNVFFIKLFIITK